MVTLEQVRQLETKITKAIDYVNRVNAEEKLLREENDLLRGKLESSLQRVDELEDSVQRFKEDQARIEEGIVAALDRLNQFEDAIGKSLSSVQAMVTSDKPGVSPVKPAPPLQPEADFPASAPPFVPPVSPGDAEEIVLSPPGEEAPGTPGSQDISELDIF
jgi:FtsZ-binding cell division protein ZapB